MKSICAILACVLCASTAHAEWATDTIGSAVSGKPLNVAAISAGDYTLGLRCRGDNTEIIYLTSEAVQDNSTIKLMNTAGAKMKLRVDRGQTVEFDAKASETEGNLSLIVGAPAATFAEIRDAKSTIEISLFIIGRNFHKKRFDARGAGDAIGKIMKSCGLN